MRKMKLGGTALAVLLLGISPAGAQLLNIGGGDNSMVGVDLGSVGGDGGGSLLGADADSTLEIELGNDRPGSRRVGASVIGVGEHGETQLGLGTEGDDDVIVNLFGASGEGRTATAHLLPGGDEDPLSRERPEAVLNVGDNDAIVDLFGSGGDEDTARLSIDRGSDAAGGLGGNLAATIGLFGSSGGSGTDPTGSDAPDGNGGAGGAPGGALGPGGSAMTTVTATASMRNRASCFSPTPEQIAHLLGRKDYAGASWRQVQKVSLVAIELCPDARARLAAALAADGNIRIMQSAVATNERIRAELAPRYQADDVLAVDAAGNQLTVYVY
jgi:hypothetical protein